MSILGPGCKVEYWDYEFVNEPPFPPKWEKKPKGVATFQTYGQNFEICENGVGMFTTAVLMTDDGEVENVPVENIKLVVNPYDPIKSSERYRDMLDRQNDAS